MTLRVLQVIPDLGGGGAERMVLDLCAELTGRSVECQLVTLYDLPSGIEVAAQRVWELHKRLGFDLRMLPRVSRVIHAFAPDIVHTHRSVLKYVFPMTLRRSRLPGFVHTLHNEPRQEVDLPTRVCQRWLFRSKRVRPVALSASLARDAAAYYSLPTVDVVYNGIRLADFTEEVDEHRRERLRKAVGFPADATVVVSVGRLVTQKNPIFVLDAFAKAVTDNPRCFLVYLGDGSLRPKIGERARSLGISQRVLLMGIRDDVPAILHAADLLAIGSDWEGSPLAVIEAMATGLPVVARPVGGLPDVVIDGETGYLENALDPFSERLGQLLRDVSLRRRMGREASRQASRYSVAQMADGYLALYEETLRGAMPH